MTGTTRLFVALAASIVVASACGDGDGSFGISSSTTATTEAPVDATTGTAAVTTTTVDGSTTPPPTDPTTSTIAQPDDAALLDDFLDTDFSDAGTPDPAVAGVDALVGGTPNATASRSVSAALEAAGVDLTGMRFYVLPVTGTPEWLLVIETGDDTALSTDDEAAGEQFLQIVIDQMGSWGITRLVVNYEGTDDAGPLVMTLTMTLADLEAASRTEGANIADFAKMQIVRPGS